MKKVLKLLPIAVLLAACSSMEADDEFQTYGDYLPSDFNAKIFVEVNPDAGADQAKEQAANLSNAFTGNDAKKIADIKTFIDGDGRTIALDYLKWSEPKMQEVYDVIIFDVDVGRLPAFTESNGNVKDLGYWLRYNIYGKTDEAAFYSDFIQNELDEELVIQTFVKYSKAQGRPYRPCKPEEVGNKNRSEIDPANYVNYFFCDNNGSVLVTN